MKHPRLSAIFVAVSAATLLMASTATFAAHKAHHKVAKVEAEHENFKGEANFKAEVPPPCPPVMMLHDGFYLGAGVGYDSYRIHSTTSNSDTDLLVVPNTVFTDSRSAEFSATGWMGGIFAGYGRYFDWFYLAAELNANVSAAKSTLSFSDSNGDSANLTMKARTSYGVALLPGIKVNDSSLLYVRLGYLRANFKTNASITDGSSGMSFSASDSEWRNGFQYGVGIETYVAENVSVRGEFDHTSFNSRSVTGSATAPGIEIVSSTTTVKPSNNEFMLSLLYHFV